MGDKLFDDYKLKKAVRNTKFQFRLTDYEREIIDRNARKMNMTVTQWCRYAAINFEVAQVTPYDDE